MAALSTLPSSVLAETTSMVQPDTGNAGSDPLVATVDPTAPVFNNVYAGMNLTDAQAATLYAVSQEIGLKLGAVAKKARVVEGPQYGLQVVMRDPETSDQIAPALNAAMDGYIKAGVPNDEQIWLLREEFNEHAEFMFGNAVFYTDAMRAEAMVLQDEWRTRFFAVLNTDQQKVFMNNQKVIDALVGRDGVMSIQIYLGSFGEPLVAPPL
jgi:hypothetical protein